jgi:hypothetical protein
MLDSPITTYVQHNLKADKCRKGSLLMLEYDRNQEEKVGQLIPNAAQGLETAKEGSEWHTMTNYIRKVAKDRGYDRTMLQ